MAVQLLSTVDQGLEASVGSWVMQPSTGNCTATQTAAQAHSGTKSLSMSSSASGTMSAWTGLYPVVGGRTYAWSAWWRTAVSARATVISAYWFQSDGATASAIRANDDAALAADSTSWQQSALGSAVAPLDAFYVRLRAQVTSTGAGAEVHYVDDASLQDQGAPYFKHGRLQEALLGAFDLSPFIFSSEFSAYVDTAEVSTAKVAWKAFLSGAAFAQYFGYGYFDSALTQVRATLQAATGVLSFAPAGAYAIGDPVRLMSFNTADYKEDSKVKQPVQFTWQADTTAPVGIGECLHPLGSENAGTITGTGTPVVTGVSSSTGAIAHLHVTAASNNVAVKLQDSTALNGAYVDIASGAFTTIAVPGTQRLIIPGTIRAYVRCVAVLTATAATYAVSVART